MRRRTPQRGQQRSPPPPRTPTISARAPTLPPSFGGTPTSSISMPDAPHKRALRSSVWSENASSCAPRQAAAPFFLLEPEEAPPPRPVPCAVLGLSRGLAPTTIGLVGGRHGRS